VSVRDLTVEDLSSATVQQTGGAMIEGVRDSSPASRAGLRPGDVLVEFDGERIRSARQFARLVRESAAGRAVRATLLRAGARQEVEVTPEPGEGLADRLSDLGPAVERRLRQLPREFPFDFDFPDGRLSMRGRLGVTLTPLTDQLAAYFGVRSGVLVSSVEEDSPAGRAGMRAGDVITSVDGRRVDTVSDVAREVRNASAGAILEVRVVREKQERQIEITLPRGAEARPAEGGQPI
jgi:serine protease Do